MSDVKEKVEMELKPFESVCDKLLETLKEMTIGNTDSSPEEVMAVAKSLGEVVDVKKDIVEMCYKKQIMEAMEESDFGEDYDEDGPKYYSGQPRSKTSGRYMKRGDGRRMYRSFTPVDYKYIPEGERPDMMDASMMPEKAGVEYYTATNHMIPNGGVTHADLSKVVGAGTGSTRTYSDGYRDGYEKSRHENMSRYDRARKNYTETKDMGNLEELVNVVTDELEQEVPSMTQNDKLMLKNKLTNWMTTKLK